VGTGPEKLVEVATRREAVEYLESLTSDLYLSEISVAELFAGIRGEERSLKQFLLAFAYFPSPREGPGWVDSTGETSGRATGPASRTPPSPQPCRRIVLDFVTFSWRCFPTIPRVTVPYER
jgi:hypothetical protein